MKVKPLCTTEAGIRFTAGIGEAESYRQGWNDCLKAVAESKLKVKKPGKFAELEAHIIEVDDTAGTRFRELFARVEKLEKTINIS